MKTYKLIPGIASCCDVICENGICLSVIWNAGKLVDVRNNVLTFPREIEKILKEHFEYVFSLPPNERDSYLKKVPCFFVESEK